MSIVIRGGTLYDGSGNPPIVGDIKIVGQRIAEIGENLSGDTVIDASGLAVAPGFINMLSWASESLLVDGRSQSDIRQGVTLEVMGEGWSMGPLSDAMKTKQQDSALANPHYQYDVAWTTLGDYLQHLETHGVSCNVASFVGSATLRIYALGYDDRPPTPAELDHMRQLTHDAMQEGAMGLSAALIYPPASFADTAELIALAQVVSEYDGLYISHIRSEGSAMFEALDELLTIAREADVRAQIYHLKAAGKSNWDKMDEFLRRVNAVRAEGLPITADMYTYPAAGTGLSSCLPGWAQDGGHEALMQRLRDPEQRAKIKAAMLQPSDEWENMFYENAPDNILLAGFKNPALQDLTGKYLSEVIVMRGTDPADTVMDLIAEDDSRIFTIYFSMTEDNLRKQIQQEWVSFCSDAASTTIAEPFTKLHAHPRAYGSFARVLGKYTRDEGLLTLQEAVRRLSALPASVLKIKERGMLREGYHADLAIFDPEKIQDHATFEQPHQYATGMVHVFVNGGHVLNDGAHTGATPGQFVRGPGAKK